jgi:REP element-mobilizing transposase RayT
MRHNRQLKDNAEYHVTARANRGEMIFELEQDKQLFLQIIQRAKKKYQFQIKNFCIMENHIHFLIKPGTDESLSRIMQWILGVFAQTWNKLHGFTGHLWGDRFFSRIAEDVQDFLRIFSYIDDNPVKAHLVSRCWEWKYGGLFHHRLGIETIVERAETFILEVFPEHRCLKST